MEDKVILAKLLNSDLKQIKDRNYLEQIGVDKLLIDDLDFIYNKGIKTIYSLADYSKDRNPELLKLLWENLYQGTEYIIKINDVSTEIKDFQPPTQQQLTLICQDVIKNMSLGKNILIHCGFCAGRTGTILCSIYLEIQNLYNEFTNKTNVEKSIEFMRENYNKESVEKFPQEKALIDCYSTQLDRHYLEKKLQYNLSYLKNNKQERLNEEYLNYLNKLQDYYAAIILPNDDLNLLKQGYCNIHDLLGLSNNQKKFELLTSKKAIEAYKSGVKFEDLNKNESPIIQHLLEKTLLKS